MLQQTDKQIDGADLINRLSNKNLAIVKQAQEELFSLGPQAVEILLATMRHESTKRRKLRKGFFWGLGIYVTIALAVTISTGSGELFQMFSYMSGVAGVFAVSQLQKNTANALTYFDDIRIIGPMAEALEFEDKDLRQQAENKLIEMLPRLKASDAGVINDAQLASLHRELKTGSYPLILAILKTLEQIGNSESVPFVKRLAEGEDGIGATKEARSCLAAIEARVEAERVASTLLRASSAPNQPASVLLRPARSVSEPNDEILLRPANSSEYVSVPINVQGEANEDVEAQAHERLGQAQ